MKCTKWTIEKIKVWIEEHHTGGSLLSTTYKNKTDKLELLCGKGHKWFTSWGNIIYDNTWCPVCAGNIQPNITDLQAFAASKNGKLITLQYKTARQSLEWECKIGHHWSASWDNIKNKHSW